MNFQGNWVDLVILLVIALFVLNAWRSGFWYLIADFISFLASLIISLRAYQLAAHFLKDTFSLPNSIANALGFLGVAVITESIVGLILVNLVSKLPKNLWKSKWNRILGLIPAVGEAIVFVAFVLTLLIGFPINPGIKRDAVESKIGGYLLVKTSGLERKVNEIFGGVIEDSLTYLTVKPGSKETIPLNVGKSELKVDEVSEREMFNMVNRERRERGVKELVWFPEAVPVARSHATDMWERRYFGHISPEGKDVGDRLTSAGIKYKVAGENLALAPTLGTAHTGLMNSEGHRENILDPEFGRIGIGVIDNGIYGKMFVQVFVN